MANTPTVRADIQSAAQQIAAAIGVPWPWVFAEIQFESGWNPAAENKSSGARGLIQFMPETAAAMGFGGTKRKADGRPTAADTLVAAAPTIEAQIPLVIRYLAAMKPFPTEQSLYMAVFEPKYRAVAADTAFPAKVMIQNPGIFRVSDYVNRVRSRIPKGIQEGAAGGGAILLLLAAAVVVIKLLHKGA